MIEYTKIKKYLKMPGQLEFSDGPLSQGVKKLVTVPWCVRESG